MTTSFDRSRSVRQPRSSEGTQIPGVQPAVDQRGCGGVGVVPVAGHDHVPRQTIADLADGGEAASLRSTATSTPSGVARTKRTSSSAPM